MNTQTKLLRECAKRTPIYKEDSVFMVFLGAVSMVVFFLTLAFV